MLARPIIVLTLLVAGALWTETGQAEHQEPGTPSERAAPPSQTVGILSACLTGRDLTAEDFSNPSPQRQLAGPLDVIPLKASEPAKVAKVDPQVDPQTVTRCLKKVEPFEDSCITVLGVCIAETSQGGKHTIHPPLVVSGGTPCSARVALQKEACAQGIAPEDFLDGDIRCGAAQF